MKRLILAGAAACALIVLPTLPAAALPTGPALPGISQSDSDTILVRRGGRGHHYGWGRGRGHHYGWSRGRHRGWS